MRPLIVLPSYSLLRCHLFTTQPRVKTDTILINFSYNEPDPRITAKYLDEVHARSGNLGFRGQFLVRSNGLIDTGRPFWSRPAPPKKFHPESTLMIQVVGGRTPEGDRSFEKSPACQAALDYLVELSVDAIGHEVTVVDLTQPRFIEVIEEIDAQEEREAELEAEEGMSTEGL